MPMGCSSSCTTFEFFSSAMKWISREKLHIVHILHLLVDFLISFPLSWLCKQQLDLFLMLCQYLGIPMAPEKTIGTSFACRYWARLSPRGGARLRPDKLVKCLDLIAGFLRRRKVTLREIESLTGLFNFACTAIQLFLFVDFYGISLTWQLVFIVLISLSGWLEVLRILSLAAISVWLYQSLLFSLCRFG